MSQPAAARGAGKELDDSTEAVVKLMLEWKAVNTMDHAAKFLEDELKSLERLDAMIHRQVKHLTQLQAWKEMLRQTSAPREVEQPKKSPR